MCDGIYIIQKDAVNSYRKTKGVLIIYNFPRFILPLWQYLFDVDKKAMKKNYRFFISR